VGRIGLDTIAMEGLRSVAAGELTHVGREALSKRWRSGAVDSAPGKTRPTVERRTREVIL